MKKLLSIAALLFAFSPLAHAMGPSGHPDARNDRAPEMRHNRHVPVRHHRRPVRHHRPVHHR